MRQSRLTSIAENFQASFDPAKLWDLGRSMGFVTRSRTIIPERFIPSLLTSFGHGKANSLADLHRDFNFDHGLSVNYKPYYDRLDGEGFSEMMKALAQNLCEQLKTSVLSAEHCRALSGYEDVIIHDGTSFALRNGLANAFPGRFTAISPAAVELHVSMSLFSDNVTKVSISPDKECERHFAPSPEGLKNRLLLADRGYDGVSYLRSVADHGGSFVVRLRSVQDPTVKRVVRGATNLFKSKEKKLSDVLPLLSKSKTHDLDLLFSGKNEDFSARMVLRYNKKKKEWIRLLTNVPRKQAGKNQILAMYRLRWQVELLFKQFKSFSCLRKFQTNKPHIALGLIWAAVAAAFLKRSLAHACQECLYGENLSTHKFSKSGGLLARVLAATYTGSQAIADTLQEIANFARRSLRRSRLERDRKRGRLSLGLVLSHQEA